MHGHPQIEMASSFANEGRANCPLQAVPPPAAEPTAPAAPALPVVQPRESPPACPGVHAVLGDDEDNDAATAAAAAEPGDACGCARGGNHGDRHGDLVRAIDGVRVLGNTDMRESMFSCAMACTTAAPPSRTRTSRRCCARLRAARAASPCNGGAGRRCSTNTTSVATFACRSMTAASPIRDRVSQRTWSRCAKAASPGDNSGGCDIAPANAQVLQTVPCLEMRASSHKRRTCSPASMSALRSSLTEANDICTATAVAAPPG